MNLYLVSTNLFQAVVVAEGAAEALLLCSSPQAGDATVVKLGRAAHDERVRIVLWSQRNAPI
jgi:hypothetical protein